ncbi:MULTISPECIES: acetolactate synthase small subunit [Sporomusa]|jgi:acetolactate synthase-1/3 small subunit|uniref:Acetolactate synthase small subunit n=2 Tax=Sporomusa TaxID=2375 RepID=A0ABP2C788_9FIRM|nr:MULTISPECIES: acetolactate synthase small subunit [Sporomusa]MCM0758544.1 acetolactate synthase small subunit [Sporomusa sphaeroides DSM 2875]OLS56094.1 putative acetolactate synthase small subunit [Sporomusa sphaeroides DSM 2875]CVK19264.1 Putative acetolactate synthase small subunit [Sporomusa sphaeroides DSM 2875]SCM82658.1 Acetolactate synthase small subunit [uncultured Sporomusa sp.]HML33468.1 acetolactate synthase small subunit [Sporomusa sphaeroides]
MEVEVVQSNVLSVLVHNQPGVLVRVAGMFSRRGFNIDSLTVGVTQDPEYSRITVAVRGNHAFIDQVKKQIEKLVEVVAVQILPPDHSVFRGLALLKVKAGDNRSEILKLAEVFRANVIDISGSTITLEVTGEDSKMNALTEVLAPYGLLETIQTGLVALERGENTIYEHEERKNYEQNVL